MDTDRIQALKTASFLRGLEDRLIEQLGRVTPCQVRVRAGGLTEELVGHVYTATIFVSSEDADIETISALHSVAAMVLADALPLETPRSILVLA